MKRNIRETKQTHEGGRAVAHLSPEQQLRRWLGASRCGIMLPSSHQPHARDLDDPYVSFHSFWP